jgi:hypothetical protein
LILLSVSNSVHNTTGCSNVVFFDENHVMEPKPMVGAAAEPDSPFVKNAEPAGGFPGVKNGGGRRSPLELVRCGGDTAHAHDEVKSCTLGGEDRADVAGDGGEGVTGSDRITVGFVPADDQRFVAAE